MRNMWVNCRMGGAGSGAPWRPWDDSGHHGWWVNVYASFSYYVLVEVFSHQIKMSATLISLSHRINVEPWYYFLPLAFLDNAGVQNETPCKKMFRCHVRP